MDYGKLNLEKLTVENSPPYRTTSMAGITLGLYLFGIYSLGYEASTDINKSGPARGLAFVGLASIQLIHALLSRSLRRSIFSISKPVGKLVQIFSNKNCGYLVWISIFFSMTLLVLACYVPGLRSVLGQWPLSGRDWLAIAVAIVTHICFVELLKLIFRWRWFRYKERCAKNGKRYFQCDHHRNGTRFYQEV